MFRHNTQVILLATPMRVTFERPVLDRIYIRMDILATESAFRSSSTFRKEDMNFSVSSLRNAPAVSKGHQYPNVLGLWIGYNEHLYSCRRYG